MERVIARPVLFGTEIRVYDTSDGPKFVLDDVCKALDMTTDEAYEILNEDLDDNGVSVYESVYFIGENRNRKSSDSGCDWSSWLNKIRSMFSCGRKSEL